ncbi:MAG: electron transfer flavoprotein subunit alpha/FixB family protein [Cyclobacteriaceae bacterium]
MSVLVFIEKEEGKVKNSSLEAIAYSVELGKILGVDVGGVTFGEADTASLESVGNYGLTTVTHVTNDSSTWTGQTYASAVQQVSNEKGSHIVILPSSSLTETICARLGAKLDASVATNVIGLPDTANGFMVKRGIFTGKAFSTVSLMEDKKVIAVKKNAFNFEASSQDKATISTSTVTVDDKDLKIKVLETKKAEGDVLLPEADLVVSAGRGLKGPENWGMIEELAKTIGAATACSKPVSDVDWRPHHEHVGQTGIKISPNLYIAIGISGAIQHLAGVSSSKTIVVINTDEDAPFFKSADYGIVGDAFEVVPRLIEALKK